MWGGDPLNGIDPDGLNPFAIVNFVTNVAMRGYGVAQTALYRYAPALTELVAGASGVNGAVVSPISPLVAQIPTTVSRMTPVARAVVEGIESGGFCAAQGVMGLSSHGGSFSSSINAAGGEIWTATGKIAQKDFVTYVNSGLYKGEVNIISGVHGTPGGATIADLSLFRADLARFGAIPGVRVHNFTEMTPTQLTDLLRGGGTTIGGFCDSGACLAPFK